jgi:lipoprotein-releasing system permease protein
VYHTLHGLVSGSVGISQLRILEVHSKKGVSQDAIGDIKFAYQHLGLLLRNVSGSTMRTRVCNQRKRYSQQAYEYARYTNHAKKATKIMPNYGFISMNVESEWKIAKRLYFSEEGNTRSTRPAVRVALIGIIIGILVMIVAISVVVGFKREITQKVAGFGSHIQVVNFDNNSTYELQPIRVSDSLIHTIENLPHVACVSSFATKPGIIKTDSAFQGIVFKGTDYWAYFARNIVAGTLPTSINEVLISTETAKQLQLQLDDNFLCYFIQDELRVRRLHVVGLYNTCMSEMDKLFILGDIAMVRQLNGWKDNQVSGIEVLVDDLRHLDNTTHDVYFATANRLDEEGNTLYTQNLQQLNPQIFGWLDLLDMNVVIIIILMLAVSGFSIVTGLIILILDSISLIGTLKALGANNRFVRRIFVYQAIMLIGKGMLWGNVIGLLLCVLQHVTHMIPLDPVSYYVSYVPMAFPWGWWLMLNVGTLFVSWLILLAPSAIVTQISPAKVMHFE